MDDVCMIEEVCENRRGFTFIFVIVIIEAA